MPPPPLPPINNTMPPPINNAMPLPPLPTGLTSTSSTVPTGPPENENENISQQNEGVGQGSKADVDEASVRSRLQVLTKDELKEVMKANMWSVVT